jgi:hypothetical protein
MMIALYFLILVWFIPMQIVMATTAERIARAKGLRSGDYFMRTLLLGFPSLAALSHMPSPENVTLFNRPIARQMLDFVLILIGCPALLLSVLLVSYCLPTAVANFVGIACLVLLGVWCIFAAIAIPICNFQLLKRRSEVTWKTYWLAVAGQVIVLFFALHELTAVEDGLSDTENGMLRNLLIPCALPLVIATFVWGLALLAMGIAFMFRWCLSGQVDTPGTFMTVSGFVGALAALAVSPLACYELALRKERSAVLWTPVGFMLPVVAPLVLASMKDGPTATKTDPGATDWTALIVIHAQAAAAFLLICSAVSAFDIDLTYEQSIPLFAIMPVWLLFAAVMPIGATRVLKLSDRPTRLVVRAAGIESAAFSFALLLMVIRFTMHNKFF